MKYTLQLLGAVACVLVTTPALAQVNTACVSACIAETCTAADFSNTAHQAACVNSARPVCEGECASPKPPPSPPQVHTAPLQVILQFDQLLMDEAKVAPITNQFRADVSKGQSEIEVGRAISNKADADGKVAAQMKVEAERMAAASGAEMARGRAEVAQGEANVRKGIGEAREVARLRREIDQLRAALTKACGAPAGASDDQIRLACKIPAQSAPVR